MTQRPETDTAKRLIEAAARLFAARGFYGVSIAAVADELGMTKQALLHHFGTKEKLYSAVLKTIADRFEDAIAETCGVADFFDTFYAYAMDRKDDMALIARELLDNEHRATSARQWFLRPFLDELIVMARRARPDLSEADALADIYVFIGAVNYYAISGPTLRSIFGDDIADQTRTTMPHALREMVRARFG